MIKRISVICLCVGVLSGCSAKDKSSVSSEKEVIVVPTTSAETTSATEATTAPESEATTEAVTQPVIESTNSLTYSIDESGIGLIVDGESVQYISLGYEPDERDIVTDDFDFDGYMDIFIPSKEYRGFPGTFYRYIPDSKQFESWDELNKIGRKMTVVSQSEKILVLSAYSKTGSRHTYYKWNNDVLEKYMLKDCYFSNYEVADYYEYIPDGSKILVKRELIKPESNDVFKTFGRDELVYFSVKENGIEVLRDGEVIETIEGNYAEIYAPMTENQYYTLEDAIYEIDFDFDGYFDVFIPDSIQLYPPTGRYYRYNPDTGLLEEWEELNKIARQLSPRTYSDMSIGNVLEEYVGDGKNSIYKWNDDGSLKFIGRSETVIDENTNKSTTTWYIIDENGNEVLRDLSGR